MKAKGARQHTAGLRWITRAVALVVTLYFLFWYSIFGALSILTDSNGVIKWQVFHPIVLGALVLTGFTLCWRRERMGGILFVLASIGVLVGPLVSG